MLLAIDIGNTNTVFAVYQEDSLKGLWRCQTSSARSADEYAAFLFELFALSELSRNKISDVIISSVVPDADFHLKEFCRKYLKKKPVFVTKDNVGISIHMKRPEDVGADRLVNALAIKTHYKVPAIVIDFGTATTFDVIDARGRYAGGVIAPGIHLSVDALNRAAAKLPKVSVRKPKKVIGKTTVEAIQSGIYWGYMGLIEGLIRNLSREIDGKPLVLATGGLAPLFADNTNLITRVDDQLTLKGLLEIHRSGEKPPRKTKKKV